MDIKIIRTKRKTISIEVNSDLEVIVRAPIRCSQKYIDNLITEKQDWINRSIERIKERQKLAALNPPRTYTKEEISALTERAKHYIPSRVEYYAAIIGVDYGRITIRNQSTRWGSCSTKGNLNFNCKLMLFPPEIIDYVVVHELCHRKEMNHSPRFWAEVSKIMPDYKVRRKLLKDGL